MIQVALAEKNWTHSIYAEYIFKIYTKLTCIFINVLYECKMRWLILWEHEECATGFEKIICMSSFYQVAKSELEPELYLCINSSKFWNVSSGECGKSG